LQTGGAFKTTVEDGVRAQVLADAATESAHSGKAVVF
jgi:myo-inositol 2-dehydrogenase/D-chiro-inositol 1-dehydrogenase